MVRIAALFSLALVPAFAAENAIALRDGWRIQSSAFVTGGGAGISMPGYTTAGWYPATVPSTVVNALVAAHVYPDPNFGMNLRSFSGMTYPISENFSNIPMPPDSPFGRAWWYRTEFQVPEAYQGKTIWLRFDGINYRANVWLNGARIASSDKMAGAWRIFEFDATRHVRPGANALAVEVTAPDPGDLAITFVDWNPQPPDKNMGLWRGVSLAATGPVAVRAPNVVTHLTPANDRAEVAISAEVRNAADHAVEGVLAGEIESTTFSQPVRLAAKERRVVRFPALAITKPRLWWPAGAGPQNLYPLRLRFETGGAVSDEAAIRFGIREVKAEIDDAKHLVFRINGQRILIRGAGYTFDMLLRTSPERQRAELEYVRDMNLNCVRLEGKLEDEHFLDLCDEYGILVLAGWCCCDHWEHWKDWDDEDKQVAAESLRDQIRRLRIHPSVFSWMNGSDNPPPAGVERMYLAILKELDWPGPVQSSATEQPGPVTGPTGVKMRGPYEYVAPSYWLLDKKLGGAHGFATEVGPGPAPPPIESLRRMLPPDHLWPIDSWWNYHAGGGPFKDIHVFTEALNARYGASTNVEEYARKAQVMAYEGHRAMFEAFGRNKYTATGVIQWMLNNAWPGMIWHLYDYYLRPGGSYFGSKKACEPLHVQYSYDDRSVVVVNSRYEPFPGVKVRARVLDFSMAEKFAKDASLDVGPDSSTRVFVLPEIAGLSPVYFVALTLEDAAGKRVSDNFYWLPAKPDVLDWEHSDWYHTPTKRFADFTALNKLPRVELKAAAVSRVEGADGVTEVTVENPSKSLAFSIRLKVEKGARGDEILPVLWEDNYFALLPGEKRVVTARYRAADLRADKPVVTVEGWNVVPAVAR